MPDLNMARVVELVRAKGVDAELEMTGGNVGTIFAGPTYEEPDYGTRQAAIAGPGTYSTAEAHTDEFCVGADDYGDGPHKYVSDQADVPESQEAAEAYVAQMIYDRVVEWAAEKLAALIEADEKAGVIPPRSEWRTFAGLQNHIDANEYLPDVVPLPEDGGDLYFDLMGKVITAADERLAATETGATA